jgi:hypothetical protein
LHRLYHDPKDRRTNRNRYYAKKICRKQWPNYSKKGQDCDEFPFASTYEGAAQYLEKPGVHYGMFSAKALNSTQNQNAGNDLGV